MIDLNQYEWATTLKSSRLRRDAALVVTEEAIRIMRDSITHNRMMVQAILAVKLACYSDDEVLQKAIAKKFEEIDGLIRKGGAA